jgi:hypothetical protein
MACIRGKWIAAVVLLVLTLPLLGMAAARQALFIYGREKVERIAPHEAYPAEIERVKKLTRWVFSEARSNDHAVVSAIYEIIPYVSNRRIPKWLRVPRGAIESLFGDGQCDSDARTLKFMFTSLDIKSRQTDIVTQKSGHVVTSVSLHNGENAVVDPYFGLIAWDHDRPLDIYELRDRLVSGEKSTDVLQPVSKQAEIVDFYDGWDKQTAVGYQGRGLTIDFTLPMVAAPTRLGDPDGSSDDVVRAGMKIGISPYFAYIGSKYDRSWVRILRVPKPIQLKFVMVGDVDEELLGSIEPRPTVEGNSLAWNLSADTPLVFTSADAPVRFRASANSQAIDFIEITPIMLTAPGKNSAMTAGDRPAGIAVPH